MLYDVGDRIRLPDTEPGVDGPSEIPQPIDRARPDRALAERLLGFDFRGDVFGNPAAGRDGAERWTDVSRHTFVTART